MYLPVEVYRRVRGLLPGATPRRREMLAAGPHRAGVTLCAATAHGSVPVFARRGAPFQLLHLLDAQCPLCQGLGCGECESTGLR